MNIIQKARAHLETLERIIELNFDQQHQHSLAERRTTGNELLHLDTRNTTITTIDPNNHEPSSSILNISPQTLSQSHPPQGAVVIPILPGSGKGAASPTTVLPLARSASIELQQRNDTSPEELYSVDCNDARLHCQQPPQIIWRNQPAVAAGRGDSCDFVSTPKRRYRRPIRNVLDTSVRPLDAVLSAWNAITRGLDQLNVASHSVTASIRRVQQDRVVHYDNIPTGSLEASGGNTRLLSDATRSIASDGPNATSPTAPVANASQYTQRMISFHHRLVWVRLMCWTWILKALQYMPRFLSSRSSRHEHYCSKCSRPFKFWSMPYVCSVCLSIYCVKCYGRSWFRRLYADRGCARCAIVVDRYERFYGIIAKQLEAGIYCVICLPGFCSNQDFPVSTRQLKSEELNPEYPPNTNDTNNCVITYHESEENVMSSCIPLSMRALTPIGRLADRTACELDRILRDTKNQETPGCRCVSWLYFNFDAAAVEFRSIRRENNRPCLRGSVHIEELEAIQTCLDKNEICLKISASKDFEAEGRSSMRFGSAEWKIYLADPDSVTTWVEMLKLAWELLAPERLT